MGEFKVIEKHITRCRSVAVWPADYANLGFGSDDASDAYASDVGKITFFSGMPIVGSDLVPEVRDEDRYIPSTDLEVMIEPKLPQDYDTHDGVVSEKHDGQVRKKPVLSITRTEPRF